VKVLVIQKGCCYSNRHVLTIFENFDPIDWGMADPNRIAEVIGLIRLIMSKYLHTASRDKPDIIFCSLMKPRTPEVTNLGFFYARHE
jgi:hypothetical protein